VERRLRREEVMTIGVLRERGVSQRAIARQLGVHENAVRYWLKRLATQARDRRSDEVSTVAAHAEAVAQRMASAGAGEMNGFALYVR
jgi:transposase-like protein